MDFSEKDLLAKKPLLDLIQFAKSKVLDKTHEDVTNLIQDFVQSLNDDLDSPKALQILEKICIEIKTGKGISNTDFNRICEILGIKI